MITNSKRIGQIQYELTTLYDLLNNRDISVEEYYSKVYPLEYELECLTDI